MTNDFLKKSKIKGTSEFFQPVSALRKYDRMNSAVNSR